MEGELNILGNKTMYFFSPSSDALTFLAILIRPTNCVHLPPTPSDMHAGYTNFCNNIQICVLMTKSLFLIALIFAFINCY